MSKYKKGDKVRVIGKSKIRTITLDDLEGGEMLVNRDGDIHKVIARFGDYVIRTSSFVGSGLNAGALSYQTVQSLKDYGWKIDQPEEEKEVEITMNEIADKFNIPVENLKIKKQ